MGLIIHAPNVHQGGGRTLLNALLACADQSTCCVVDERMPTNKIDPGVVICSIKPTLIDRFKAEVLLAKNAKFGDTVLCFGNLPPLIKSPASVKVFLQNRYLFGKHDFSSFSISTRLRLQLERWWFRTRMQVHYTIIVQSLTMQRELKKSLGFDSIVLPFSAAGTDQPDSGNHDIPETKEFDFVYVSSAEPHKNHAALLDTWAILADQGVRPNLALTVSESSPVAQLIERSKNTHGLKITNFGTLQHGDVQALYANSKALIFPSKLESFGLPLLEAQQLGMPILAPELDYVRDVVEPNETFNADSPTSMARAVMRHMNIESAKSQPICAAEFLARIQETGQV
jgi:glycosyltransferase involved in cell wall biosynthesis